VIWLQIKSQKFKNKGEIKMEEKEILENEEKEALIPVENNTSRIMSFNEMRNHTNTLTEIYTNIDDKKKLYNIGNKVDFLLNDCEGELIKVKGVVVRRYLKPMKNPVIDEETGEILKDTEMTMSTVLVDENGKSYATGSKLFGIQLMRYIEDFGLEEIEHEGLLIRIIKKEVNNGKNKGLAFELV